MLSARAQAVSRVTCSVARRSNSTVTLVSGRPGDIELRTNESTTVHESERDWDLYLEARRRRKLVHERFEQLGSYAHRENTWQPHHSLHRPLKPSQLTLSALVASGAHYGHSKSLLNSAFTGYAYGIRSGIVMIDLDATLPHLRRAANVVRGVASAGGTIIFVGTKPELGPTVRKAALRMGHNAFHIADGWTPGMFTNKHAIFGFEVAANIRIVPDLVVFLNPLQNMQAIRECALEHVPTIGIIDSNVDPRVVLYPIPANDDSIRTGELVAGVLSIAGREGLELWRQTLKSRVAEREKATRDEEEEARREEEEELEREERLKESKRPNPYPQSHEVGHRRARPSMADTIEAARQHQPQFNKRPLEPASSWKEFAGSVADEGETNGQGRAVPDEDAALFEDEDAEAEVWDENEPTESYQRRR